MAEDLQGLLDRIQNDGLQKAETEREKIIADAKAQAEKIVADANAQAEAIMKKAKETADDDIKRGEITIRQAARDIIIALKGELLERLRRIAKDNVAEAMTPQLMAQLVATMADAYAKESADGLELILSRQELEALIKKVEKQMKKAAAELDFESAAELRDKLLELKKN